MLLIFLIAILFLIGTCKVTWWEAVYYGICACGIQHIAFDGYIILCNFLHISMPSTAQGIAVSIAIFVFVYVLCYFEFIRNNKAMRYKEKISRQELFSMLMIIVIIWCLSELELSGLHGFEANYYSHMLYRILDGVACIYIIWFQIKQRETNALNREIAGINEALERQTRQYQMTAESIRMINLKCHDMKHQIRKIKKQANSENIEKSLEELEYDIMIYDSSYNSGNFALDTVLMEKGRYCQDHNIQWSCMADGLRLLFMESSDIYALLGNALDNAIEATEKVKNPDKRVITVRIIEQNQILVVQIQNYFSGTIEKDEDGLPCTTKEDTINHGFGMKSMKYTVEKYGGTLTVNINEDIFMLQLLLPSNYETERKK